MARLTALRVREEKKPGRYGDGNGLYLQVSPSGTKSWLYRFTRAGRAREMGLGPVAVITLQDARERALSCRRSLIEGRDPIEARKALLRATALQEARVKTFDQCAASYIDAHRPSWKNEKHYEQWKNTLATYVSPIFGALPVADVDTAMVLKAVEPIWVAKTETASRVRSRIELVLSWSTAHGFREGENPARWRGHLDKLLPKPSAVRIRQHHKAMPVEQVPIFCHELRGEPGVAAKAFEFLILTGVRTGEVLGAQWSEISFTDRVWTIPRERMKAKKEHRVPLTPRMEEILRAMEALKGRFIFPGRKPSSSLSNMALLAILRRMNVDATAHGFRSSFRDWTSERTNFSREVAEAALAHCVRDKVEAAYRRGDLFEKRRQLMAEWGTFCGSFKSRED